MLAPENHKIEQLEKRNKMLMKHLEALRWKIEKQENQIEQFAEVLLEMDKQSSSDKFMKNLFMNYPQHLN